jgi:hypothetical protein
VHAKAIPEMKRLSKSADCYVELSIENSITEELIKKSHSNNVYRTTVKVFFIISLMNTSNNL